MMARSTLYPLANTTKQWFADDYPGGTFDGVDKVLLHTTEGPSWPPYKGGSEAPNLTYHPALRLWRQHFPLNRSSRALCDPASTKVRENRDRVVQVEIVAVCDPKLASRAPSLLFVERLSDDQLADIGKFLAFMHAEYGVPLIAAPRWLPFPDSYGNSRVRLPGPQFDVFKGVLGHQHASGNVHGDPGALDVPRIIRHANLALLPGLGLAPAPPGQPSLMKPPALGPRDGGGRTPLSSLAPPPPTQEDTVSVYRLLRTPDKRLWGAAGLQVTHLETPPIKDQYLKMTGLKVEDAVDVTYDLIAQFQRIT